MKTYLKLSCSLLSLLSVLSCSKGEDVAPESIGDTEVKLVSQICTRVSNNQWDENDEVGLYMYRYGSPLSEQTVYSNAANCKYLSTSDGHLSPATEFDKMYYPLGENVNFIAYYPFGYVEGYSVNLDVSKQDDLSAIDFLYSNSTQNISATATPQQLTFAHQLSRVVFRFKASSEIDADDLDGMSVVMRNAVTSADFSLVDGKLTLGEQTLDIQIPVTPSENEGETCAESIMIPQQCENVHVFVSLTSGKTFYFVLKDDNQWISGQQYTYEIDLSDSMVGAELKAVISEWTDGVVGGIENVTASQVWDGVSVNTNWYADEADAFVLYQPADLAGLAQLVNDGNNLAGKTIYLSANLDMGNQPWTPIGDSNATAFKGTFIGNNFQIKNLTPVLDNNVNMAGLFGISEGVVQQLLVSGEFDVECEATPIIYVGAVCGINKGTVQHCRTQVNISVKMKYSTDGQTLVYTGGVVGDHQGTLLSCQNYGTVTAENNNVNEKSYLHIGGIVGGASNGAVISDCENTCKLIGRNGNVRMGGIVAIASGETVSVSDCTNWGQISIEASHNEAAAGGVVGKNAGGSVVTDVRNKGDVSIVLKTGAKAYGGGLIGMNDSAVLLSGENEGNVSVIASDEDNSASAAGGIVGYNINAATIHLAVNKGTAVASNAEYCFNGGITGFNSTAIETLAYTYDCCTNTGMPILWIGNATATDNLITTTKHTDE